MATPEWPGFAPPSPPEPAAYVQPEMIVRLFEISQLAFLLSVGLLLSSALGPRAERGLSPLAGISWVALELNLLATVARLPFQFVTHFFEHRLTAIEIVASVGTLGALVAVLNLRHRTHSARPKERFATGAAVAACFVGASTLGWLSADAFVPYVSLAFSVFVEAAAMAAQRQHFGQVKRMPPSASNALVLLAASRALRLLMWACMCWEGEYELALMAADTLHIALVSEFIAAYVRSRRAGTSDLLLAMSSAAR